MTANRCAIFDEITYSPLGTAVGGVISVVTTVFDPDGDEVEVWVTSDCGEVADPIQVGDSATTVRCDEVKFCLITVRVSDDGFDPDGCNGTTFRAQSTTDINCQP